MIKYATEYWAIIKYVIGLVAGLIAWYYTVSTQLEQFDAKIKKNGENIEILDKRISLKHDMLLEIKFNLENLCRKQGVEYIEVDDFKEDKK